MTTWKITVKGTISFDIVPSDKTTEKIDITSSIQQKFQTASFDYTDKNKNRYSFLVVGNYIDIYIDNEIVFEGFISQTQKSYVGGAIKMAVNCIGNTFEVERYLTDANKTYTNKKSGYIVKDLLDTYAPSTITHTSVSSTDGATITSIVFNEITLGSAFQRLAELDGYRYYIGNRGE